MNGAPRDSQNLVSAWRIHATKIQDDAQCVSREHRDVVTSNRGTVGWHACVRLGFPRAHNCCKAKFDENKKAALLKDAGYPRLL